LAAARLELASI